MRKQEETNYEVIIVGAGPSGLAAALTLLEEGISDLIVIERFEFPRYKCCAGYITGKTKAVYETFGLNIEEAHYSLIRDFNIFYRLKKRQTILNKFLYTNLTCLQIKNLLQGTHQRKLLLHFANARKIQAIVFLCNRLCAKFPAVKAISKP